MTAAHSRGETKTGQTAESRQQTAVVSQGAHPSADLSSFLYLGAQHHWTRPHHSAWTTPHTTQVNAFHDPAHIHFVAGSRPGMHFLWMIQVYRTALKSNYLHPHAGTPHSITLSLTHQVFQACHLCQAGSCQEVVRQLQVPQTRQLTQRLQAAVSQAAVLQRQGRQLAGPSHTGTVLNVVPEDKAGGGAGQCVWL